MDDELDGLDDAELWLKWIESPEGKAREKIHEALTVLSLDPEITASPICAEFLKLMIRISPADPDAETLFDLVNLLTPYFNKRQAQSGATAKLAIDPKQREKAKVRGCWDDWQIQPDRYKGKAEFARDMLAKYENLKSQPVIERWCRTWGNENLTQLAQ